jgi:predicted CXXCH cytochrome family protein
LSFAYAPMPDSRGSSGGLSTIMKGERRMTKVLVVIYLLVIASVATAAEQNLVDLHKNAGAMSNKQCLKCHGKVLSEKSTNKKFKTMHRVHLESKLGTPKKCTECHASVDLREGSAGALRKQVDPQICAGCHDGGMKGAKKLFE